MGNDINKLGRRAKVGLILPSLNTVTEPVFYALAPEGISFHTSRTLITGHGLKSLMDMEKEKEIERFFTRHHVPGTEMKLAQTLERIRIHARFIQNVRKEFS